jgi:hypothetical protein
MVLLAAIVLAVILAACSWTPRQIEEGDMAPLVVVDSTVNTTQPSTP